MGGKGGRFLGTSIKDTWTRPKRVRIKGGKWGWLGWGERWEGNGDNYTSTIIKSLKKALPDKRLKLQSIAFTIFLNIKGTKSLAKLWLVLQMKKKKKKDKTK